MRTVRYFVRLEIWAALCCLSSGCITFEEQTLSYQHRPSEDRLLIHNIYSGIHGDSELRWDLPQGALTEPERAELIAAVEGRQLYFFDNWMRVIDLDELQAQLETDPKPDLAPVERRADDAKRAAWAALVKNVTIANGPFFQDQTGRLCAVQHVTLVNLSETLKLLNVALAWDAAAMSLKDPEWSWQAASVREWLAFDGNLFTVRYRREDDSPAPVTSPLDAGNLVVTRRFGAVDAKRVTITERVESTYIPNAVAFVRTQFGIDTEFDPQRDADRFFGSAHRPSARRNHVP